MKAYSQNHIMCDILEKRGGQYPGKDIPEFYPMVEELFTPEEAEVYVSIPKGVHTAEAVAREMGRDINEIRNFYTIDYASGSAGTVNITLYF